MKRLLFLVAVLPCFAFAVDKGGWHGGFVYQAQNVEYKYPEVSIVTQICSSQSKTCRWDSFHLISHKGHVSREYMPYETVAVISAGSSLYNGSCDLIYRKESHVSFTQNGEKAPIKCTVVPGPSKA